MYKLNFFDKLSIIIVLFFSLNWGTIALLNFNFITALSFNSPIIQRIIYILIFLSALDLISLIFRYKLLNNDIHI